MARYTVDILDNNGQRIGFVPAPASPEYRRRQNQATSFSFGVLMDDDVASLLTHGRQCVLRRDGVERVAGAITRRDVSGQVMRVECITNEALLRDIVTPADWNYWAGWKLGDAVRDLLMDFAVQAHNTPDDWEAAVEKVDVDVTTWPGKVVLAKDATGHYKSHGYITLQLDFGLISRYQALRWSEDAGQEVRIKAQFRTSADGTSWSAWSQELQSVFPAEDGVALTGSERYIQVRMHLYTDNTSAKDQNGVPTGYTPVLNGVEVIARKPGPVSEGVIEDTEGVILPAYRSENEDQKETYSFNRENALRILQTWCEDFGYEFRVDGERRLYFGKNLGAVRQVVLRRTTNMDVKSLGDSADRLVNVLHCYGAGDGPAQIRTILRNQDSINLYGERYGEFEDSSADTLAKLIESGNKHLAKVAQPEPQFVAHHVPVHELGEDIQLYDTVTVVDPKSSLVAAVRILDEERKLTMAGEDVSLGLNCDLDNVIERIVKGQAKRPRPGGLPPEAPRNLRAYGGYGYIHLSWIGDGEIYIIEHSLDGETFERLDHTGYRNYLHAGLDLESVHYYRIFAMRYGMVSPPSETVSAMVSAVRDDEPPVTPTGLTATGNAELLDDGTLATWVDLTWTPNTEPDLHDYAIQRRAQGTDEWQQLVVIAGEPGITAGYRDEAGLVAGRTYEYQIAASDLSGNRSEWSATAAATIPDATTGPPVPTGLTGQFVGGDAIFAWDPCPAPAFKRSRIQIVTSDVVRRTAYTSANTFIYTLAMNKADHSKPSPNVTIKVAHEDRFGNRSAWASVTAIKAGPEQPQWFAMSSTISQIIMDVASPDAVEVAQAEFQLATRSDYADAATAAKGAQYAGVLAPARTAGTNYGRVRYIDVFGQAGAWRTGSTVAKLITRQDMQGAIWQIVPTSTPTPSSGMLEQLWDMDTATGPTFGSAATIEFEFPIAELTDMVRLYPDRNCYYYVQAFNGQTQTWVNVAGSATAKIAATGNRWNVRRFDGGKVVAARRLRIIFDRALKLSELKFWRTVMADEIISQVLYLTSGMAIQNEDGSLVIDPTKIEARGPSNKTMFRVDLTTGEGYFGGDVVTKGQVWKAVAPPRPVSITPSQEGTYSLTGLCVAPNGDIYLALTALNDTGAPVGAVRVIRTDFSGSIFNEATYVGLANLPCITNGHYFNVTWWSKTGQVLLTWVTESAPGEPSTFGRILLNKSDLSVAEQLPQITLATNAQGLRAGTLSNGSYVGVYDTIKQSACFSWSASTNNWRISDGPATTDLHYMDGVTCLGNRTYALVYSRFGNDTTRGMYMMRFDEFGRYDSAFGARRIHNGWLFGDLVAEAETGLLHYVFRVSDWAGPPSSQAYQGAVMHGILNENGQWVQQPRLVTETWGLPMNIRCDIVDTAILGRSNRRILTAASCKHDIAPIQWFSMEKIKLDGLTLPEMAQEITP